MVLFWGMILSNWQYTSHLHLGGGRPYCVLIASLLQISVRWEGFNHDTFNIDLSAVLWWTL